MKTAGCLLFALLTLFGTESMAQTPETQLECRDGIITMSGPGELYDFGGGKSATKQRLSRIYYLFTDSPDVYIKHYKPKTQSPYNRIAFKATDSTSFWYSGKYTQLKKRAITDIDVNLRKIHYRWSGRAFVLFDTQEEGVVKEKEKYPVGLVTLPIPKDTSHFSPSLRYDNKGQLKLKIKRGKRIVFDSIVINGEKQEDVSYNGGKRRDTPFYNIGRTYAEMPITTNRKNIEVTVFYRYLCGNGAVESRTETMTIKVPKIQIMPIVVTSVFWILVIVAVVIYFIKKKGSSNKKPTQSPSPQDEVEKELKDALVENDNLKRKNNELKKELGRYEIQPTLVAMIRRSDELLKIAVELEQAGNRNHAERIRNLIRGLINERQQR